MTRREQIEIVLNELNEVAREMGVARNDMRDAHRHLVGITHGIQAWADAQDAAADAHDRALARLTAANRAAVALLHEADE